MKWIILILYPCLCSGVFFDIHSTAIRNAKWLKENRLHWYHSYVPDVLKILSKGTYYEEDFNQAGFDPGDISSLRDIEDRLSTFCPLADHIIENLRLSTECASDLSFLVCSGANLTRSLIRMASNYCQDASCLLEAKKLMDTNLWTSKFIDSYGKMSGGLRSGSYMHLGNFQECVQLIVKKQKITAQSHTFDGKFCRATFSVPLSETRRLLATKCYGRNLTQGCESNEGAYIVQWGFCVPKSCNLYEVNGLFHYILNATKHMLCPAGRPMVMCDEIKPLSKDIPALIMTIICVILVLIMIASTIYDLVDRKILTKQWLGCLGENEPSAETNNFEGHEERPSKVSRKTHSKSVEILFAFSIYTNLKGLLNLSDPKRDQTRFLDGIRVLSMAWIVLAEVHVMMIDFIGNITMLLKKPSVAAFQSINNSSFATDTFLLIGGFLLAYWWLKNDTKHHGAAKTAKRAAFALVNRLLRLLPVYIFILGLSVSFWSRIGDGPMWTTGKYSRWGPVYCPYTFWTNILFINNFVALDHACLSWTWFVALDLQLYLLAIPLLIVLKKVPLVGFVISTILILLSLILNGVIVGLYGLAPSLMGSTDFARYDSINAYYEKIYIKPYTRWNAYLIGIMTAFSIRRTQKQGKNIFLNLMKIKPVNTALWASIVAVCSVLVYGLHGYANGHSNSIASVAYAVLARTSWSIAIAILIILCFQSAGISKWFLSWPFWTPLSRMTYSAFLMHGLVIIFFYGTSKEWMQYSCANSIYHWLSALIISYALGFMAYLSVEAPFNRIGQILFTKSAVKETSQNEPVNSDSLKLLDINKRT